MKKVYYAHSLHLYNSKQEERDVKLLESLGFEVLNPNSGTIQEDIERYKTTIGVDNYMSYFEHLIQSCEIFAFRAHVDGKIPSGVGYELDYAINSGKSVIELPTLVSSRRLSLDDTREYLKLTGQR